jgi:UDP-glucose 6-dehydrogenase
VLNSGRPPIYQEFLAELLGRNHGPELPFIAPLANGAKDGRVIFTAKYAYAIQR